MLILPVTQGKNSICELFKPGLTSLAFTLKIKALHNLESLKISHMNQKNKRGGERERET